MARIGSLWNRKAVVKRVIKAWESGVDGDYEEALFDICAALEKTARLEGRPKGRNGFKGFVKDNVPIIAYAGTGTALAGLEFGVDHPDIPVNDEGRITLEDLVYVVIRCGLYHEAELPGGLRITQNQIGPGEDGALQIPRNLIVGIIIAVAASPVNKGVQTTTGHYFGELRLDKVWGERDSLLAGFQQDAPT